LLAAGPAVPEASWTGWARYDGTYDKANLPDDFVMTSYFSVRDDKIVSLAVIFNQPSPY
jgi:hypothetical protein